MFSFLRNIYYDIKNYIFIIKTVKKNKDLLIKNNIRVGWVYQLYTVINLTNDDVSPNDSDTIKRVVVVDKMRPLVNIINDIGLAELYYPIINKIKDVDSYLVILMPNLNYLNINLSNIIKFIIYTLILFFIVYFTIIYLL